VCLCKCGAFEHNESNNLRRFCPSSGNQKSGRFGSPARSHKCSCQNCPSNRSNQFDSEDFAHKTYQFSGFLPPPSIGCGLAAIQGSRPICNNLAAEISSQTKLLPFCRLQVPGTGLEIFLPALAGPLSVGLVGGRRLLCFQIVQVRP